MEWLIIGVIAGFILGIVIAFVLKMLQNKTGKELVQELYKETETQRKEEVHALLDNLKANFGSLSLDALSKSGELFLGMAKEELEKQRLEGAKDLEAKKGLIDQQLKQITLELEKAGNLMKELEKDRGEKFGELSGHLKKTNEQTAHLMETTNRLNEILASSQARGQWGERMAEDVLRLAGFIEKVNYIKQGGIDTDGERSRPDFTFLLPNNLKLNMDVKFPLSNYVKYIDADKDSDKERYSKEFLRDVKNRIKEITDRNYIDPGQNTVDYVLMFIPNEDIFSFIHRKDSSLIDESIKNKVVICSPMTLFAVLAVIRQAVDNFTLERTSNEIFSLLGKFRKQWEKFQDKMEKMGKKISEVQKEYDDLTTTRKRGLEKPLDKIDSLRMQKGLLEAGESEED